MCLDNMRNVGYTGLIGGFMNTTRKRLDLESKINVADRQRQFEKSPAKRLAAADRLDHLRAELKALDKSDGGKHDR